MNSVATAAELKKATGDNHREPSNQDGPELFDTGRTSRSRIIGLVVSLALLISGAYTFMMLIGLTSVVPDFQTVLIAAAINGTLILILFFLIGKEVIKIIRSRQKGRVASRLHVRIVGLFCLVAALPAILVAIVAGITLDLGLDRWFEVRTKKIIESSVSVARAYQNETTRVLMGNTLSMAANIDRNRRLFVLDREGFTRLFTLEARGRGLLAASLVDQEGNRTLDSKLQTQDTLPPVPELALELAREGNPVPIPPGNTNLVGVVLKLKEIPNSYLYTIVAVPPAVIDALRETQFNSEEYNNLEQSRLPFQFTFALLYVGICLIVLLAAMWMGFSVANRIVTPIRRLMSTASEVSDGNLNARVDVSQSEGDLRFLSNTFNEMLTDLQDQQGELVEAKELMDQRARFIEAVLSGVSAAVIGVDGEGEVTIANRSAVPLLGLTEGQLSKPNKLADRLPQLGEVLEQARSSGKSQYLEQVALSIDGRERTFNVQVTVEEEESPLHSFVITLDDITDLVAAQRNTAWADVARRIAHEIKNPLTPIQLSAERIKRRYGKVIQDDREVFDNCTDTIIRQVGDIGRMVDEFSAFARMPKPEMAEGDLRTVIKDTVFLQKVGFPDIKFDLELPDTPITMVFDSRMISQGLINVLKNAAEAIEGVGDEQYKGQIAVGAEVVGERVVIEIIDNGKGLPEENRQRLLEPYMTTREKGTGLGLAIVRKIAEDHGGQVDLMDAPDVANGGQGAMTRITLPVSSKSAQSPETERKETIS